MAQGGENRIQLCGRFVLRLEGEDLADSLRGGQARLLLAYLVVNRGRAVARSRLAEVLWGEREPKGSETTIRGLIFRLRQVLGAERLEGKAELRLSLPDGVRVDVEEATSAVHRAESAIAQGRPKEAWLPARVALSVSEAGFLTGVEGEWAEEQRRELDSIRIRALECIAETALRLGGPELSAAERAGRSLIKAAPFRESGYLFLIEALEEAGNVAEGLRVFDEVRCLLRDELGIGPSPRLKRAHERLISAQLA